MHVPATTALPSARFAGCYDVVATLKHSRGIASYPARDAGHTEAHRYIAQTYVIDHGGIVGRGSTFTSCLPARLPSSPTTSPSTASTRVPA
jgi:hypothetical protein